MKSKTITHIILEGCDGIGKNTIAQHLWPRYNFRQRVYVRGEISDYVYANKYHRRFIATQRGLPFLYVVLTGDIEQIKEQIIARNSDADMALELSKVSDNALFEQAAKTLQHDYHILTISCKGKTIEQLVDEIYEKTTAYINSLEIDDEYNAFNAMYAKGCRKLNIEFNVKGNQPYFEDTMIMADAQLHNGSFETFSDKTYAHNLIFSLAYDAEIRSAASLVEKTIDFCYPINSKILVRPEVYTYFSKFNSAEKTFLTTRSDYVPQYKYVRTFDKCFGNEYILTCASARATIYTARELSYLNMMTVRAYEAVLARQIIFVDCQTDTNNEILSQIYPSTSKLDTQCRQLLFVTPETIINNYNIICSNETLVRHILTSQDKWYDKLVKDIYSHYNLLSKTGKENVK